MSVLIRGMKMPDNCESCAFATGFGFCLAKSDNFCGYTNDRKRPEWCPLVEVSEPHGGLVDANKLIMHLADYQLQESPVWGSNGYGNADKCEAITDCIDAVESACTVIEAEDE